MNRQIAWLNGEWTPLDDARISPLDRGFLFGDGVYEVIPVYGRRVFAFEPHLKRLRHSLRETAIPDPFTDERWRALCDELVERHPWDDQYLYVQVTRGVQPKRDHLPQNCLVPTVFAYASPLTPLPDSVLERGVRCIAVPDIRWRRCDIKAITLLANVMTKLEAQRAGVDDAILIRDGFVSEGTASNVFIAEGERLITPPLDHRLLGGITRQILLETAGAVGLAVEETPISLDRLRRADEIWLTSSTKEALPVVQLDDRPIGNGRPGPLWHKMRKAYQQAKARYIEESRND